MIIFSLRLGASIISSPSPAAPTRGAGAGVRVELPLRDVLPLRSGVEHGRGLQQEVPGQRAPPRRLAAARRGDAPEATQRGANTLIHGGPVGPSDKCTGRECIDLFI